MLDSFKILIILHFLKSVKYVIVNFKVFLSQFCDFEFFSEGSYLIGSDRDKKRKSTKLAKKTKKFFWRVWSWLRVNAGGVPNTCKSNDEALAC